MQEILTFFLKRHKKKQYSTQLCTKSLSMHGCLAPSLRLIFHHWTLVSPHHDNIKSPAFHLWHLIHSPLNLLSSVNFLFCLVKEQQIYYLERKVDVFGHHHIFHKNILQLVGSLNDRIDCLFCLAIARETPMMNVFNVTPRQRVEVTYR